MALASMMFVFENQIRDLIGRIAEGEGLNADELVAKYLGAGEPLSVKAPAAKKKREAKVTTVAAPTTKCTAKTAKGKPCSLNALPGTCMCRVHANKAAESPAPPAAVEEEQPSPPPAPTKKKAAAKKKKAATEAPPIHTHTLDNGDENEACELCHTHGNALDDENEGEEEFETVTSPRRSLRQRLMEIAQAEEDYEDEDDD